MSRFTKIFTYNGLISILHENFHLNGNFAVSRLRVRTYVDMLTRQCVKKDASTKNMNCIFLILLYDKIIMSKRNFNLLKFIFIGFYTCKLIYKEKR